jgi:LysR family transcriptional regulator, regulator of abg operon
MIAVAERGSVRSAARHLGCSQPAVTRSIHEIERELGTAILERTAKGVVLTAAGELFVRRAITIQEELRRARDEIEQLKGRTTGSVSIGLSTASHIALFPYALERFKARYPNVFLDISEGLLPAMEKALQNGSLDFYVGPLTESPTSSEFTVEKLFDNERLIFGRKGHPLASARTLRDLAGAKWIATSVTVASDAELGPLFARAGLPSPTIEIQAHFALTMIMAAASSDLLTMLPQQWAHSPLTTALLHTFEIAESLPAAPICIVKRARLPLTPAAEYFCDMMRRAASHWNSPAARANSARTRRKVSPPAKPNSLALKRRMRVS